jgi:hypothetical protein
MPNGGAADCDKARGIPRYAIIGSYEFDSDDLASIAAFKAALLAQTLVGRDGSGKLIVLPIFADIQKKTADKQTGTLNQGFTEVLREGFPAFDGGMQISNKQAQLLRPLNGQNIKVFIVDHNLNVWGTWTEDETFRGESAKLFMDGDDFTDGQASKVIYAAISYTDIEEFKNSSAYFPIDFSVAGYGKLKDVYLEEAIAATDNVFRITGKIKTGRAGYDLDMYEDFSTQIANVARWVATNDQTGAAFTITSVAVNAAGYWTVTLDSTAWTALGAGDSVTLNFAAPSVLHAAGATGIEGVEIVLTKPA